MKKETIAFAENPERVAWPNDACAHSKNHCPVCETLLSLETKYCGMCKHASCPNGHLLPDIFRRAHTWEGCDVYHRY